MFKKNEMTNNNESYLGERCYWRNSIRDAYCNGCNITKKEQCPIKCYRPRSIMKFSPEVKSMLEESLDNEGATD